MSRAFVKEDAGGWGDPGKRYSLPGRTDPGYDEAAAEALLEGARSGDTGSAESATGYYWGEPKLRPHVERILVEGGLRRRAEHARVVHEQVESSDGRGGGNEFFAMTRPRDVARYRSNHGVGMPGGDLAGGALERFRGYLAL